MITETELRYNSILDKNVYKKRMYPKESKLYSGVMIYFDNYSCDDKYHTYNFASEYFGSVIYRVPYYKDNRNETPFTKILDDCNPKDKIGFNIKAIITPKENYAIIERLINFSEI